MQANGQFLGVIPAYGSRYGLTMPPADITPILLLRLPAVNAFRKLYPTGVIIEIDAPLDILTQRLTDRGDTDRIDPATITKEITAGRQLADLTIDTTQPIDDCLSFIEKYLADY